MSDVLPQILTTPIPANEAERLAALHRYKILDTPPEAAFDRITGLAARLFKVPTALISLVDESRAWFKSCIGFGAHEVPRDATLCSFAVLTDEPLIVPNAQLDERFACNPFVQSEPGVRFYAGAPLLSQDGFNLGTLCLLDSQPRPPLSADQQATLVDLAAMVVDELELRLAAHKIAQVDAALVEITQGVATVTGEAFIDALVQYFARVLDVDYVYIGLVEGDSPKRMRTIATCAHGQLVENLEYLLQETPCWEVLEQRKICSYPRNVQAHFPHAPLLKPLSVESYVAAPFFDDNGNPLGLLGVMDGESLGNVHLAESLLAVFANRIATELERQQTQATLRQSEAKYRSLFESIDQGFCICELLFDANGEPYDHRFLEVNLAFERLTGLEQAAGKTAQELIPDLEPFWLETFAKVVQTGNSVRFEQQLRAVNRWFDVNAFCMGKPQSNQFTLLFTNMTERKQAELDRERLLQAEQQARSAAEAAREEAQAANRIKDEFLAVLSHELRSPLNPILGWTRLLQSGKLDSTRQVEALKTIERNAKLQAQLIEDLLDISRIMQGKMTFTAAPVSLTFVISAALETVRLAAEAKQIQILLDLDSAIAPVSGDAARLQQVIWNLLTNAVKFTPPGGQVSIELRQVDQLAQIRVIDTGKGIHPQFLPHVFEYFRQEDGSTTRRFGGLGLGLAIVRQIVELHGGRVEAESLGEGQGATFIVRLPLGMGEGQEHREQRLGSLTTDDRPLLERRVLVVDDEPDMRALIAFSLEQAGAEVVTATAAEEALTVLPQFQPDVLLSDIGMPDIDGYMLLRQIRSLPIEQGGETPAIALTAYAGEFNQQQALQAGFQQHLAKPVDPEHLVEAIVSLLRSQP